VRRIGRAFGATAGVCAALCWIALGIGRIPNSARAGDVIFISNRYGDEDIVAADLGRALFINLTRSPSWDGAPSRAPDGTKLAFASLRDGDMEIYVMRLDGVPRQLTDNVSARDSDPAWSPDGTQIAFASDRTQAWEVYVMDADGSNVRALTRDSGGSQSPAWSPDGRQIAYVSYYRGNAAVFIMNADGSDARPIAFSGRARYLAPSWSPDGAQLAMVSDQDSRDFEIYRFDIASGTRTRLTESLYMDTHPTWTANGTQIIFETWRDGNPEIYIMNVDGSNPTRLTDHNARDGDPS
jgi:Tol biopolymer transport system component